MEQEGNTNTEGTSSDGGGNRNTLVTILAVVLVIAVIALIAVLVWAGSSDDTDERTAAPVPMDSAAIENACLGAGGTYVVEHNECENMSAAACEGMGGTFDECGSACRHMPADAMCTAQCVPVCSFGGADAGASQPKSVIAQLNGPLICDLREEPVVIGDVTATYGCRAPGAFLTQVDTGSAGSEPWTAGYFTTDTQITEVKYGPEEVTVLPNPETQ